MFRMKTIGLAAALTVVAASGVFAQSQQVTFTAAPPNFPGDSSGDTAQVGTKGPASSQKYLDIEGSGNGSFSTFGVVDFSNNRVYDASSNPEVIASVDPNITLDFTDSPFSHTAPGTLNFYLSNNNVALSTLKYNTGDTTATAGVGNQLDTLYSLGQGSYTSTSATPTGNDYPFTLTLSSDAQNYFVQQLNSGGNLRFVITADSSTPNEVASLVGATNAAGPPSVTFSATPVPEVSSFATWGAGMGALGFGLLISRRRRNA